MTLMLTLISQCYIPYLHRHGLGDQHQYHYEGTHDGGLMLKHHKQRVSIILLYVSGAVYL